ncbi:MAG: nuclear transport factor 2 family protein [Hyphomonadaceae bacterium]|nr:nuclear transport factor 2 family protein [Hyphomonadaceae bacterium]
MSGAQAPLHRSGWGAVLLAAGLLGGCVSVSAPAAATPPPVQAGALSDIERAAIEQACEDVSERYAHYLDTKDYERMPTAFAPDGVWEVLGNRMQGPDQIREYWRGRTARWAANEGWHHQIANHVIEVVDRDHARGTSWMVVYRFNTEPSGNRALTPLVISRSTDEYVRTSEGWRLQRRSVERVADAVQPAR